MNEWRAGMDAFGLTEERRAGGDLWGNVEPEVLEARRASPWLEDDAAWMQMKSETAFSWPKDAPFAVALSHDVDFFRRSGPWARPGRNLALAFKAGQRKSVGFAWHLKRALRNAGVLILGKDGFWGNCRPWMEVEEKHGFVSTCFFSPGEVSWRKDFDCDLRMNDRVQVDGKSLSYADVIREVRDRGGEVGLHGSYYAAESAEVLREQKLEMESVLGGAVEAYRNHFLHYVPGVTELLLNDAGFALDSTLGYNRHVGYRTGFSFPHPLLHPLTEEPLACWELPMSLMDVPLFSPSGLHLAEEAARQKVEAMLEQTRRTGGCLTVNWHPPGDALSWKIYEYLLRRMQELGAWGTTCGNVVSHFRHSALGRRLEQSLTPTLATNQNG